MNVNALASQDGVDVFGQVGPGFESMVGAALANLTTGEDIGLQIAAFRDGDLLFDLHGGYADAARSRVYPSGALHLTFSASKAMLALCAALLVDDRRLVLDAPVATYWPEFAQAGKSEITVRQLLNHQAGIPAFQHQMSVADLANWQLCVDALAAQPPTWAAGRAQGYHAVTIGYLVGELVNRVSGLRPREFFAREIAGPLSADAWFGVPDGRLTDVLPHVAGSGAGDIARWQQERLDAAPGFVTQAFSNPPVSVATMDVPAVWQAEIPAVSLVANARALALCMSVALPGPTQLISGSTLAALTTQSAQGADLVLIEQPSRYASLFMLSSPREPMLSPSSFGHNGLSGSLVFADRDSGISFAYLGNRAEPASTPHSRVSRLMAALRECV
ncbi:CubicO group peptidase, beta-lactamase class C family [Herbiconiux ginsengi]|uniref:CubicO group peptidase, beta-lactamase class C family n=2 Tax=Herbiconiux ginsengi TaxID=381665 RepID=A0A1H3MXK1_9MICO|nr:CubicO group peptidase, beta-lactamase class C family [Herbiconiux ginsengi]